MEGTGVCTVPASGTHPALGRLGGKVSVEGEVGGVHSGRAQNSSHGLNSLFSQMGGFCLPGNQRAKA